MDRVRVQRADAPSRTTRGGPTLVNLVAYEWQKPDDWRSVVIQGQLRGADADTSAAIDAAEVFAEHASVADLTVFKRPVEELDPVWYELQIEETSGHQCPHRG